MRRWMLGGFVAVTLVMSACGGGDEKSDDKKDESKPGTRDEYVDAFKPGVATMGVTDEQATCIAEAAVDTVGVDKLNKVTNPREIETQTSSFDLASLGLSEEEGGALYDKMDACVDIFDLLANGADPATVDCLRQNVTDDMLREVMVGLFTGSAGATGETATQLNDAYTTCSGQTAPTVPAPAAP
jgi:hypothetical protein